MNRLIGKYTDKIVSQGLAHAEDITFLCLDAELTSNRPLSDIDPELTRVFELMNISSLLYAEPAEPYRSIFAYFSEHEKACLIPNDCETRTFLHDIPIIPELSAEAICSALSKRKAAIVKNRGIVSYGTVSPEQAFVSFSSVCFSTYVKFFSDVMFHLEDRNAGKTPENKELLNAYKKIAGILMIQSSTEAFKISPSLNPSPQGRETFDPTPLGGEGWVRGISDTVISSASRACTEIPATPPLNEKEVYQQLVLTGRELVRLKLVDSYFGNISYVFNETIYISQTGSSLDELETCIDAVPLNGSSSSGITASSELTAHISVHKKTGRRAILHGHPKFTVIMSMACRKKACDISTCYRSCKEQRAVSGIPIVSGEIGTGLTGLAKTVPEAMTGNPAVIVFGHGIFSAADSAFSPAFELLQAAEAKCMQEYFTKIQGLI